MGIGHHDLLSTGTHQARKREMHPTTHLFTQCQTSTSTEILSVSWRQECTVFESRREFPRSHIPLAVVRCFELSRHLLCECLGVENDSAISTRAMAIGTTAPRWPIDNQDFLFGIFTYLHFSPTARSCSMLQTDIQLFFGDISHKAVSLGLQAPTATFEQPSR